MKLGVFHNQSQVDKLCATKVVRRQAYGDMRVRGLQLEILPTGTAKWRLRYLGVNKRRRSCLTLGSALLLTLNDARGIAEAHLRDVLLGKDPQEIKLATRQVPTFGEFINEQYMPYIKSYKRSWTTDQSILKNHLLPRFEKRYMDDIQRQDVFKMHQEVTAAGAAPGSINRLIILLRFIYNLALLWEVPGIKTNPSKGVQLLKENNKRDRYLSVDEARRLYEVVCQSDNIMLKYIVPMLILTGARKREVLDAEWQNFDLERRIWRIPLNKSGTARHVPLSDGALTILRDTPKRAGCPYPFANPDTLKPYASIFRSWATARNRAGLPEVRVHDLRHSFASLLINQGRSLYEVQSILGHTQVKTTQRYAHLANETLLAAANAASLAVASVITPKQITSTEDDSVRQEDCGTWGRGNWITE
jgi:integrase